ncbi:HAD-IC family P-type ATPase [Candidatus Pacearchaeota archaeon]|nr:HAD-IC family P-type ATPase [Candidatus Pacearchaeota archaeon]
MNWYSLEKEEVLEELNTDIKGLTKYEAAERTKKYGKNEIIEEKPVNPLLIFFGQLRSVMIYILIAAAVISYFFHHLIDFYIIIFVIILNSSIGFIQEYKTERAIQALKKMIVSYAKVYREGDLVKIPAHHLVPGDIIILEEGDRIPADCRLLEIKNLTVNESSLTGEALPSEKALKSLPRDIHIFGRKNMVFMGTFVSSGSCKAVVVSTGVKTAIGQIASEIQKIPRQKNHFQKKSDVLAKQIGILALMISFIIFFYGYFVRGFKFQEILLFTVASIVAIVPEGLPAVLAIVLAIGAYRMSKRNALIRKLSATETLGVVTTIITDKTGTLTENTMNIERIFLPGYGEISVTGEGWIPKGDFLQKEKTIIPMDNEQLRKLLHIGIISNNSNLIKNNSSVYEIIGDPTEASFVVLGEKAGIKKSLLMSDRIDDLPFSPHNKFRASLVKSKNDSELYVIGAPEVIISKSSFYLKKNVKKIMNQDGINELEYNLDILTKKGMRVLALAYRKMPKNYKEIKEKEIDDLIIVGLVGILDPPRSGVKDAIMKTKRAGIRVIMATGDHKITALAIANEIGFGSSNALTGEELEKMSDNEFNKAVRKTNIFARLTPDMKLKIATNLQNSGEIIAMTGDGVNDAPALKKADIGISMGIIGTDVARESSEIVLTDDNFASIVNAIEEGRIVFTNTRQATSFLVTTNFAAAFTLLAALIANYPLPLIPIQILWLNLVTSGVTDVSLAAEPGHNDVLTESPKNKKENFLSKETIIFLLIVAVIMIILTLVMFNIYLKESLEKARTVAFMVMCFTQLFNVFNMRSMNKSLFKIGFLSNKYVLLGLLFSVIMLFLVVYVPFLQNIFQFVSLSLIEVIVIILLSSLVFWAGEIYKFIKNRKKMIFTPFEEYYPLINDMV